MSSYLVIARKWRPSLFEEIVGQGHVTRTLKNAISSGRVAHAYLFSGPRGVGKTTAARILAKSLNCASGPTPLPCNICESCKGIAAGSSVDVFEVDGASNNSVDNIRELTESIRYVPSQGKYKVYIIDEVHMLSTPAFNALLKTLEEPPPHAVFIFATTEVHKIPLTILSRCQRFDFKRIPFKELQHHLKRIVTEEGIKFEDKAIFTVAREADGSLRDGQSLLEQVLAYSGGDLKDSDVADALGLMDRSILYEISGAIISKDAKACLNIVEKIYNFGYDLKRGCSELLEHIRDLTVIKATADPTLLDLPESELERLNTLAAGVSIERLHMLFGIISKGYEEVVRGASPRFSFEMALLRAAHFDEIRPVDELVSRLESLRQKIDSSAGAGQTQRTAPKEPGPLRKEASPLREAPAKAPLKASEAASPYTAAKPAAGTSGGGLIDFVRQKSRPLAGPLEAASVNIGTDSVTITAGSETEKFLFIKRELLQSLCAEFFGRPMKIEIKASGTAAPEKKKETDPIIKDAVRVLGGRVIEDRRRTNV
ncbi:MAG: DNA polymerase III subunit gamma/tau [Deltaproteobacteria bacterium]|nr:DNA polymerase III subunit gamma/tau [Deltaproteobacteria bacterium]